MPRTGHCTEAPTKQRCGLLVARWLPSDLVDFQLFYGAQDIAGRKPYRLMSEWNEGNFAFSDQVVNLSSRGQFQQSSNAFFIQ